MKQKKKTNNTHFFFISDSVAWFSATMRIYDNILHAPARILTPRKPLINFFSRFSIFCLRIFFSQLLRLTLQTLYCLDFGQRVNCRIWREKKSQCVSRSQIGEFTTTYFSSTAPINLCVLLCAHARAVFNSTYLLFTLMEVVRTQFGWMVWYSSSLAPTSHQLTTWWIY